MAVSTVALLPAACSALMGPIGEHVFSPPAGWTRYPTRPGGYPGWWGHDTETITLNWFDVPKNVSFSDYDASKEQSLTDFHIVSSRAIPICGTHPARIQVYRATVWFGQHIFTEVVTKWGDTLYVARYQRLPYKPEIRAATESLKTLCAGVKD
jgi:hypothetical protein